MINSALGLFAPRTAAPSHSDFLFGSRPAVSVDPDGATGGSFGTPMYFAGDSPRSLLILYCSFVDGIDRGIQIPLLYTLKSAFHLSQLAASAAIGLSLVPWLAKPILALMTDTVPIQGLRRKPYIIASAGVNAISLSAIAWASAHHFGGVALPLCLLTVRTFGRAMIDAAAQGLLLEDCRGPGGSEMDQSKASVLISRFQAAHRFGQFLNVCASGFVMATSTLEPIYFSMAAVHVGTMLIAWSTDEQRVSNTSTQPFIENVVETIPRKFHQLTAAVSETPAFTNVLEYTLLSVAVPSYEAPMTYYLLDARHFSAADISLVNIVQTTGSLIAPVLYATFCQRSKYSSLMSGLTVASIPAALMPVVITSGLAAHWGMNEVLYASLSAFTLTVVNDLALLPANVLIAQLAPQGLEGSAFSLLTVVEGTGRVLSNVVSATLPYAISATAPKYRNMTLYIFICTVFNVGPFTAIEGFDDVGRPRIEEEEGEELIKIEPTFGGVIRRELRDADAASPVSVLSIDSESSPHTQVPIVRRG